MTPPPLSCCVCGQTDAALWRIAGDNLLGGDETFQAVRCARCQTVRLDPRPAPEVLARHYAPDTYARAEEDGSEIGKRLDALSEALAGRVTAAFSHPPAPSLIGMREGVSVNAFQLPLAEGFQPLVEHFKRQLTKVIVPPSLIPMREGAGGWERNDGWEKPKGSHLDIGCGDGRFLSAMARRGWGGTGIETDTVAAALARRRNPQAVIYDKPVEELALPENQFGLVSLLHVLEHVPDPRQTLAEAWRVLKPGGALLLALPNVASAEANLFGKSWYHLDLPRHLWGFTPHSLTRLVEETGFSVRSLSYQPWLFALQSVRNAARGAEKGTRKKEKGRAPGAKRGAGGKVATAVFGGMLAASTWAGRSSPGEIMEMLAVKVS